ncbi:AMP-binding protein [Thermobifida halotolerans]|uniref:AMP-binding protein n=1 Tax=Thermobifida halotolerans TaxID=483545 RepID=A0AA97LXE6_9ACTN|nr:AMP-binding protein [Thermobifida halotolerans]UOE19849.1 AMP-binding protein [Thermobifida halotolerans]
MRVDRLPRAASGPVVRSPRDSAPIGSLTGGLLDRLRRFGGSGSVIDHQGARMSGAEFAATVQRAAIGMSRRGLHPNDVVAVLAPVSTARLVSVHTAMAVGCVALPLELTSDIDTLIRVLVDTDARMILVTGELAPLAVELAERSRVRQVVSFDGAPETTPFAELLRPAPHHGAYDPAHCLFDSGLLDYAAVPGAPPRVIRHPHRELAAHFRRLDAELRLSRDDTVVLENGMTELDRCVLASVALWNGASVLALPTDDEAAARAAVRSHRATVRVASGRP